MFQNQMVLEQPLEAGTSSEGGQFDGQVTDNPVLQAFPIRRPASRQKDETATDLIGLLRRRVPRGADEPIEPSAIKLFPC